MTDRYIAPPSGQQPAGTPAGNDTTGTGLIGAPWASISKWKSQAVIGDRLICRGGTYAQSGNQGIALNIANTSIEAYAGELPRFNVSRNTKWLTVTASGVTIDGLNIVGAGADVNMVGGSTSDGSYGIYVSDPLAGFTVRNCHISDLWSGIWIFSSSGWHTGLLVDNNIVERLVYAAIMIGGDNGGVISENLCSRVGMTGYDVTNGNSYGIAITMEDGSGFPSKNTVVNDNVVEYVPLWEGVDTHGGVDVTFRHNIVRYCARGFFITSASNTPGVESPTRVIVEYNLITFPLNDPSRMPPGTDRNVAMREYDGRNCIFRFNHVGTSTVETGIAYPTIFYDTGGLSTGTDEHDNTRSELLPDAPGEEPPPPSGGSAYDTAILASSPTFYPLLADVSGHVVDSIASLTSVNEAGMTYRAAGPLAVGSIDNYGISYNAGITEWNDATALDLGNTFSIELLVKRAANGLMVLVDKGNTGGLGYALWFTSTDFVRLSAGLAGVEITTSTASVTDTAWHHIVATKSGATVAIYIDGVEGHSGGTPGTVLTNTTSALAVAAFADNSQNFTGTLTRVAFYTTALSGATVSAHYAAISAAVGASAIPSAAALILNPGTPVVNTVAAPFVNPLPAALTVTGATPTVTATGKTLAIPGAATLILGGGFPSVAVSGGSLALVIGGVDKIGVLKAGTLRTKTGPSGSQGVADFTLIDFTPADNATVVIRKGTTTYYSGFVRSRSTTELKTPGHWYCQVGCQDDIPFVNALGNAPFAFSDTPNNVTTFGYENIDYQSTSARGVSYVSTTTSVNVRARRAGIIPGHTVTVTSANNGLSAVAMFCNSVEIAWPTTVPVYTYVLGDPVVTLVDTIIYNIGHPDSETAAALATALHTPKVFTVLPPLPDPAYPLGTIAYLTTDGKIYRVTPDGLLWTNVVDGTDILVASITAGVIAAGAIGAEALAAELVLASKLVTPALTGARLELDPAGFRAYDSGNTQQFNVPVDGSAVQVTGQLTASTLTSTGAAEFDGTNLFAKNSVSTLASGVMPPNSAPQLAAGWNSRELEHPAVESPYALTVGNGYWDTAGGANGATACYVAIGRFTPYVSGFSTFYRVIEWRASDWLIDRTTQLTGMTLGPNTNLTGITRIGANWYVAGDDNHLGLGRSRVTKVNRSTGAEQATATRDGITYHDIATNGTVLYLPSLPLPATPAVETWTTSPAFSSTKYLSLPPATGTPVGIEYQGSSWWIVWQPTSGGYRAYNFVPASGLQVINRDFPVAGASTHRAGIVWDGTVFHSSAGDGSVTLSVADHTVWDWTTVSAKYWVGYSWYDSAGTTHETPISPRSSITMGRRQRLQVSTPAVPTGGADDPNNARIYMQPSASSPAVGSFKLQVTDALTTRYLTDYASGGTADGIGTAYVGVAGAKLASTDASGWALWGDGTATMPTNKYTESTTFTISGGGTATYGSKVARWWRLGNLVAWRLSFTITNVGSGGSTVTVTNPGWPIPPIEADIWGNRGTVGPASLTARIIVTSGDIGSFRTVADGATITGADLANTATYSFNGAYYAD